VENVRIALRDLRNRCDNPNHQAYDNYGGKGITYDPRWKDFSAFWEDMADGYFDGATIDRIDNTKGYFRDNCQWLFREYQTVTGKLAKRKDNKSGISGVEHGDFSFRVIVRYYGAKKQLYRGKDFFEACCVRKSWEAQMQRALDVNEYTFPGARQ
jgi:hypothetical protein